MAFRKILVANRGEIACRIIRTARAMGYETVAVFSDADAQAPHVGMANVAVRIGGAAAADSYLRIDAILQAAVRTGADAVHPGYGFLSENAAFAQACCDAGLVFIGPPAQAIRIMGDKVLAKARMVEVGVPVVPGAAVASAREAAMIGYPVMVKAVAGGGGRGMRLVRFEADLADALDGAGREARSAFGDGTLMLEKFVKCGRHVEFQLFADAHGNCVHMGERDCTAQRRRQKVIEESPSPALDDALRARMAEAAVRVARAVDYRGAGTVEFILDGDGNFYFLEMNTRLQVEHPVTECVTGLDLVAWQLRVANGESLPLRQEEIQIEGHAIEARLCAEDPYAGFTPQTGMVRYWRPEHSGIRVDAGVAEGSRVSPHYDSLVAKFIAHGTTRDEAIRRLVAGLEASPMLGLPTNAGFLKALLSTDEFAQARMYTGMIDDWADSVILQRPPVAARHVAVAAAILAAPKCGFRSRGAAAYGMILQIVEDVVSLYVTVRGDDVLVRYNDADVVVRIISREGIAIIFEIDGVRSRAIAVQESGTLNLAMDGEVLQFTEPSAGTPDDAGGDIMTITTPVAGQVLSILPKGALVAAGDVVAVIEAMKIETRIFAQASGVVSEAFASAGGQVMAKKILALLVPAEKGP